MEHHVLDLTHSGNGTKLLHNFILCIEPCRAKRSASWPCPCGYALDSQSAGKVLFPLCLITYPLANLQWPIQPEETYLDLQVLQCIECGVGRACVGAGCWMGWWWWRETKGLGGRQRAGDPEQMQAALCRLRVLHQEVQAAGGEGTTFSRC